MGILDALFSPGGLLGAQAPKAQYDWAAPGSPGGPSEQRSLLGQLFGNGLTSNRNQIIGYLAGALGPGTTQERISRGLAGAMQGSTSDIMQAQRMDALQQSRQAQHAAAGAIDSYVRAGRISPQDARFFATNPKAWEAYSQALVSPQTVTNGQTTLQATPMGGLRPVYVEPYKPEMRTMVNPLTGVETTAPYQLPQPHGFYGVAPPLGAASSPAAAAPGPQGRPLPPPGTAGLVRPGGAVQPSARVWGDAEAERAGLYEPRTAPVQPPPQRVSQVGQITPPQTPDVVMPGVQGGFISKISPQQQQELEGTGKGLAEAYTGYSKNASAAAKVLGTLSRMEQLNFDPRLPQGRLAPAIQTFKATLASFGIDPKSVAPGEEFTSLQNKLVLDATNGSLGAGVSNADVGFISRIQPDLAHSAEGRKQIIETAKLLKQREIEVYKQAQAYKKANGTLDGFEVYMADWAEKNPLFKNRQSGVSPPAAQSAQQQSSTVVPSEFAKMNISQQMQQAPEGSIIRGPMGRMQKTNGQWVVLK